MKLHIPFLCSLTSTNLAKATSSSSFRACSNNTQLTIRSTPITDKIPLLGSCNVVAVISYPAFYFSFSFPCLWSFQRPHWRFSSSSSSYYYNNKKWVSIPIYTQQYIDTALMGFLLLQDFLLLLLPLMDQEGEGEGEREWFLFCVCVFV